MKKVLLIVSIGLIATACNKNSTTNQAVNTQTAANTQTIQKTQNKISIYQLNKDFTVDFPAGWSAQKSDQTKAAASGLVTGKLLNSYDLNLPGKFNDTLTSVTAHINVFSDDHITAYSYDNGWIFYDSAEDKWYAMNDILVNEHSFSYLKNKVVLPHSENSTNSGTPILSQIGYGDAGCSNTHNLIHLKEIHLIVDFDESNCFTGDETSTGPAEEKQTRQSEQIFIDFQAQWLNLIKSFKQI